MTAPIKVLSCDGGGIRGLLTAIILEALEAEIKKLKPASSLSTCFDVFAGTSTGSIIACGIAHGLSATKIRQFYEEKGTQIFPEMNPAFWAEEVLERVRKGNLSLPLFDPKGLEAVLRAPGIFPDTLQFGMLQKATMVISYDTYNRKAIVFKSQDKKSANIPVWQVCRASAAAPVAFPGFQLKDAQFLAAHQAGGKGEGDLERKIPNEGLPLIDGGILANNPALCAIAEQVNNLKGKEVNPLQSILVASFGTGQSGRRITPEDVQNWGALDWSDLIKGVPLYQVCADGSADAIDYIANTLLGSNYQRYQPVLYPNTSPFQADKKNLQKLQDAAGAYLKDGKAQLRLQQLAAAITT